MKITAILVLMVVAFSGCRQTVGGNELIAFMADRSNGLIQETQDGKGDVLLQYLPSEYELWQDIRLGAVYSQRQADSVLSAYDQYYYFRLLIREAHTLSEQGDGYDGSIRNRLYLVRQSDTLPCAVCQKIANGNSSVSEYLLAFPFENEEGKKYGRDLMILFKNGNGRSAGSIFIFSKNRLNKIPRLKI